MKTTSMPYCWTSDTGNMVYPNSTDKEDILAQMDGLYVSSTRTRTTTSGSDYSSSSMSHCEEEHEQWWDIIRQYTENMVGEGQKTSEKEWSSSPATASASEADPLLEELLMHIPRPCYLNLDLSPGAKTTAREATYLEFNVDYMRMSQRLLELTKRTGMPITQENGQRRYGPRENYNGPPVERGSEVFVGKLPRDLYEDELVPVFETAGEIYEVRLMMDFSGTNRGYCFVHYFTAEAAANAIKKLNDYEIRPGRFLGVVKSVDNCRLFIGGIPRDKTKQEILVEIQKIAEGVVRVIANPSPVDRSKNRGYAFIEFDSHRSAAMARRKLIPGKIQMWGVTVAVDWAEPEPDVDASIMSKVMNLYVRNVSMSTTEDDLRELFNANSRNGVDKVKKIKDYAFIHFLSRPQAEEALNALDETELDGATLEITWAKPVNKVAYKAKKAYAKQLYSPRHGPNHGKGNYEGHNSDRIFGQYNSLSCTNNQQIVYHQMTPQPYHNGIADYSPFQYQNGSLLHHDVAHNGRTGHVTQAHSAYGNFYHSGQFLHSSVSHSKTALFAQEHETDSVYGSYSSGGHPGMYIPIPAGHSAYRNGPILTPMTPYITTQLGIPYI